MTADSVSDAVAQTAELALVLVLPVVALAAGQRHRPKVRGAEAGHAS